MSYLSPGDIIMKWHNRTGWPVFGSDTVSLVTRCFGIHGDGRENIKIMIPGESIAKETILLGDVIEVMRHGVTVVIVCQK